MSPTNPLCAIYPLCNYMNLLMCMLYCTFSHVSTLWLKLNITVIIFTLKGTLKIQPRNFHENLIKIVKIKVCILLFLRSPSIILARSDPLFYM